MEQRPTSQVLCRYHMNGACKKGSNCLFSHNMADLPNITCQYWLQGVCAYGERCRYLHKRPAAGHPPCSPSPSLTPLTGTLGRLTLGGQSPGSSRTTSAHQGVNPATRGSAAGSSSVACSAGSSSVVCSAAQPAASCWQAAPSAALQHSGGSAGQQGAWGSGGGAAAWQTQHQGQSRPEAGGCEVPVQEPVLGQGQGEVARDAEHEGEGEGEHEGAWQEGEQGEWEGGEGEEWEGYEEGWEEGEYEEYAASNAAWQAECEAAQWQQPGGSAGWPEGAESTEGLGQLQEEGDEGDHPLKFTELCSHWAAYGNCPHGLHCRMVHGEECETCHKRLIHPFNPDLASEHAIECIARHEKLEAHLRSAAVECGICYERVLSAPNPSDRRFGLMSCDHAFCLTCIRTWRASNAADTEAAIRTCPICRVTTHFVTPSATWPESPAAKEAIVSAYRAKLAAIDCVHFRRGEGTCPFGTSCFYRHMRKDGQLESRDPGLRITRGEAGAVHVLGAVRLADFLETLAARRVL